MIWYLIFILFILNVSTLFGKPHITNILLPFFRIIYFILFMELNYNIIMIFKSNTFIKT